MKDADYVSSAYISVKEGETIWFGPCDISQSIQVATFDKEGQPISNPQGQKPLEAVDVFGNNLVIYKYVVPEKVENLCFTTKKSLADVYVISKTELTCLNWVAYWKLKEIDTAEYVGENEFYEVKTGDKIYFGAITQEGASDISVYDNKATKIKKIQKSDLKLVESFGKEYGVYCYSVNDSKVKYIQVPVEESKTNYYASIHIKKSEKISQKKAVDMVIASLGLQRPLDATVESLQGKKALFLGGSVVAGAEDKETIYGDLGWAGRIAYFAKMDVQNEGVAGACIAKKRVESEGEKYIYNNLVSSEGDYDFVILQGGFHDAEEEVEIGVPQGKETFDIKNVKEENFADALEIMFFKAKEMYPKAKLGYIVDFKTDGFVNQEPYVEMAIDICEDWGIPYLDLYHDTSFSVETKDGIQPTSKGYDTSYMRVATWMASLNGKAKGTDKVTTKARIMSYNVFWSATDEVPNKGIIVRNRVQKVQNTILSCDPDVLVLQEVSTGRNSWIPVMREFIKEHDYGFYGFGHYKDRGIDTTENIDTSNSSGSDVEMTPILWKKDKYECVEKGHYWASSNPKEAGSLWKDVPSAHESGRLYPRCVNWLVLKDKDTKEHIMIVSYHADPYTEKVRKLSAQLVMEKVAEVYAKYDDLAVVMAGDWNMERQQPTYSVITGNGYADAQKVAEKTVSQATFNAWKRDVGGFAEADYVFVNHNVYVSQFQVYDNMDSEQLGIYDSDHCPVIADIEY